MHVVLQSGYNPSSSSGHVTSSIRCNSQHWNLPIWAKDTKKVGKHLKHDFTGVVITHWQCTSMYIVDIPMFLWVDPDSEVKIRGAMVSSAVDCNWECPWILQKDWNLLQICCTCSPYPHSANVLTGEGSCWDFKTSVVCRMTLSAIRNDAPQEM